MRRSRKKDIILKFLEYMETKDSHMVEFGKFSNNSIWSKDNPQPSHRTMINVSFKVDRLNGNDKEIEIEKWLMNEA